MEVDQLTLQWAERDTNVKPRVRELTCNNCTSVYKYGTYRCTLSLPFCQYVKDYMR